MTGLSAKRLLGIALSALLVSTPGFAARPAAQHFACNGGTTFAVTISDRTAVVRFSKSEHYRLLTKPFSLGQRFVSPNATLIIDGQYAAFVTSERTDLENCTLVGGAGQSLAMGNIDR